MVKRTTISRVIAAWLSAMALVLLLDIAIFRTKLYPSYIEPISAAGWFEITFRREQQSPRGGNLILTVGNSRFAYYPEVANQIAPAYGYIFRNGSVAGSDPRVWYYLLRDLDPQADRYRAVVFGVDDYDDYGYDFADALQDMHQVISRLRWSDAADFPWTYHEPENRIAAFRGTILKGVVYQADVLALLDDPRGRIKNVRESRLWRQSHPYDYTNWDKSVVGLEIDWTTRKAIFPATMTPQERQIATNYIQYRGVAVPELAEYKRLWFGRILDHYKNSRTKIVFVRLPRGPIAPPPLPVHPRAALRELASRPNVFLSEEHEFEYLEHPELFRDYIHLNHAGAMQFTPRLVEVVIKIVGRPD